jgi:CO dehydrogenase maturation factor
MGWTLAITGKGGVGKTTLAALAVRWLIEQGRKPVLAVDADPNSSLDALLGVRVTAPVGAVREEVKQLAQAQVGRSPTSPSVGGMGKPKLLEMRIQQSLVEADNFDLLAMGRPEGPGCYCYANNVLGAAIRRLTDSYPAIVIDNEAGLENLSRRLVQRADRLVFVADPSARGLTTARRLYDLALEMKIAAGGLGVVVNRARDTICLERARQIFDNTPVTVLGCLPEDAELGAGDAHGEPIWTLPTENPLVSAAAAVFARLTAAQESGNKVTK